MTTPDRAVKVWTEEEVERARSLGTTWLGILGRSDLVGLPTKAVIGDRPMLAEEFPLDCEEQAAPLFKALEVLQHNDPRRMQLVAMMNGRLAQYFEPVTDV